MPRNWTEWESRVVGGFPLLKFLGSSESSAVFRSERAGEPAAIKLRPATGEVAKTQLTRWERASHLSHSHLQPLLQHGSAETEEGAVVYAITEYAEEVLSEVDRPLESSEALDMLAPALNALAYLHGKGFAHGRLKPSNIVAVADRLKLSGDAPLKFGERHAHSAMPQPYDAPEIEQKGVSAAADVWSLGMTLVEVLTRTRPTWDAKGPRLPEALPENFREIARKCLQQDPAQRTSVAEILEWLQAGAKPQASGGSRKYLLPGIAAAAVIAAAAIGIPYFSNSNPAPPAPTATTDATPAPQVTAPPQNVATAKTPPPALPKETPQPAPQIASPPVAKPQSKEPVASKAAPTPPPAEEVAKSAPSGDHISTQNLPPGVVQQVLPDVPPKSRTTVHGKVPIMVRVQTDASGAVTNATVEAGKLSTYFAAMSLKAAKQWRFAPGEPHDWMLRFEYTRDTVHPVTVEATQR